VHFSRYQMLRIMGKETSKRGYDRIQSALNRLVSVTVVSKNAFWDNNAKQYVSEAFHLFDSYRLYDERSSEKGQDQQSLPLSNVVMSEFLFNSIKAGYIKDLNTKFYFGLETPLSKRLYRYLDKKRYHKSTFEIRLLKLAALLPIQDKYLSQIKRRLGKAHDELIKKGFLQNVSYENTSDNDEEKVIYIFSQASLTKSKETDLSVTTSKIQSENRKQEDEEPSLEQQLVDRGVTKIVAAGLAKKYPTQEVEKQIDIFDWLLKIRSPLLEKNPAGFLRKSIEENYEPPADYLNWQKREIVKREREQEAIEKEAEQSKLDEIQRQVDEYRDQLSEHDRELLHKEAIELIENDENIKKEFVSEFLIRAFEAEIIKKKLGI